MLFTLAPVMVMIGAVAVQLVLPYTDGLTAAGLNVGLIFIVAITGFTTMAILLGGWSSRNKYSLVGALRSAAQMISYEIPMILGLLVVAMIVGSLNINDVVAAQAHYQWIAFYAPFTFLVFYIASIAELNRGPFDLPESESELVAGYGTEYSGMRFGMFFLNEYAGLTIMSMVAVTLFFGGWQGPFARRHHLLGRVLDRHRLVPRQDVHPRLRAGLDPPLAAAAPGRPAHGASPGRSSSRSAWSTSSPAPRSSSGCRTGSSAWPSSAGSALFAFVGLFDPILKRRLRRQRERLPVVNA